jgi:RNA polymerase sigma-70 factor (ECF subfamily)
VTDEALMLAIRDGQVDRLAMLFDRHHRALFGFFYRMTGDRPAAEDLVQEVFVRVLKYRAAYREQGSFKAWLFRIARNARHDFASHHPPVERIPEDTDLATGEPGPAAQLEHREAARLLRHALSQLPADRRELIILARYHGMSYEELGALMDAEPGTIRVRLHRALRQLDTIFQRLQERPYAV